MDNELVEEFKKHHDNYAYAEYTRNFLIRGPDNENMPYLMIIFWEKVSDAITSD